jgi:hypothetical protein
MHDFVKARKNKQLVIIQKQIKSKSMYRFAISPHAVGKYVPTGYQKKREAAVWRKSGSGSGVKRSPPRSWDVAGRGVRDWRGGD